jgi:hypothetical protein
VHDHAARFGVAFKKKFCEGCDCRQYFLKKGLRNQAFDFHPELDLMNMILNTKVVLKQQLSNILCLKSE